jgi:hypothetical protein
MTSALKNWTGEFGEASKKSDFGGTAYEGLPCFLTLGVLDIVAVERFNSKVGSGA